MLNLAGTETLAAWIQALGSIVAIVVAIVVWHRQSRLERETARSDAALAREIQKRSMQPHLSISRSTIVRDRPEGAISVTNNGVGPAIVRSVEIFLDGRPFEGDRHQRMLSLKRALNLSGFGGGIVPEIDQWIPAGESFELFMFSLTAEEVENGIEPDHNKRVTNLLNRIGLKICYQSVFEEQETCSSVISPVVFDEVDHRD